MESRRKMILSELIRETRKEQEGLQHCAAYTLHTRGNKFHLIGTGMAQNTWQNVWPILWHPYAPASTGALCTNMLARRGKKSPKQCSLLSVARIIHATPPCVDWQVVSDVVFGYDGERHRTRTPSGPQLELPQEAPEKFSIRPTQETMI